MTDKEVIEDFAKRMVKFWDKYQVGAFDCPSLDIYFKDRSYLKFFIFGKVIAGIPMPTFCTAYADERYSMEFPSLAPALNKGTLKSMIKFELQHMVSKGIDLNKEIDYIGEVKPFDYPGKV